LIGVAFACLGVFLVWRYLTEINFVDKEAYFRGEGMLTVPDRSAEALRLLKRAMLFVQIGSIDDSGWQRAPDHQQSHFHPRLLVDLVSVSA